MKKIVIVATIVLLLSSCTKKNNFSIEGAISNAQNTYIYLDKLEVNGKTSSIDSAKIDNNGNFKLGGSVSYPTFFLLKINDKKFITLLVDSLEKIKICADIINFDRDYSISGSLGSLKVQELNNTLRQTNAKIDSISSLIKISGNNYLNDIQKSAWLAEIDAIIENQITYSKNFVTNNPFSLASVLAIYQKFDNGEHIIQDIQTIKIAASALNSMYPNSAHAKALYNETEKLVKQINAQKLSAFIEENGQDYPDINLPNQSGKNVSLSSLKGKVVLVQFWSALDKSSLMQTEVLKENYSKFKSKGFEIYQVSIDNDHKIWKETIESKGLQWINVGDMKGSISALTNFNIQKIPSNYLIGKDGSILAKDLFGPALHNKLNEILN